MVRIIYPIWLILAQSYTEYSMLVRKKEKKKLIKLILILVKHKLETFVIKHCLKSISALSVVKR